MPIKLEPPPFLPPYTEQESLNSPSIYYLKREGKDVKYLFGWGACKGKCGFLVRPSREFCCATCARKNGKHSKTNHTSLKGHAKSGLVQVRKTGLDVFM